jgi:hypothetical protein
VHGPDLAGHGQVQNGELPVLAGLNCAGQPSTLALMPCWQDATHMSA